MTKAPRPEGERLLLIYQVPEVLADFVYVRRLWTFVRVDHFELDAVTLDERLETLSPNRGVVNEHITGTVVPSNEAITFLIVKPLYFSTQGSYHPFDAGLEATTVKMYLI